MAIATILRSGNGTDTSDATATSEYILSGYSGYVKDELVMGEMPYHDSIDETLLCGESYTIPKGAHSGTGKVTAEGLESQTEGTATEEFILVDKTIWVNGVKLTGTMPNKGAVTYSLPINGTYTIPVGYHNGSGSITQSISTQGGSTITPGTANKTAVAAGKYVTGNIICAGDANLVAGNIKKGVSIFGVTGTYQGF